MNNQRNVYTKKQIELIETKLRSLPLVETERNIFSKQEAISMLKNEILKMQKRGYGWNEISEALKGEGILITSNTLKNYIQRARSTPTKRKVKSPLKNTSEALIDKSKARFTPSADSDEI